MKNRRNFYRILQVQPDAPLEVIRASYRVLMRELKQHPDHGGQHWDAAVLNEAYATLRDPRKREEYDKMLLQYYTYKTYPESGETKPPIITIFCPFCKTPLARKAGSCTFCRSPLQKDSEHVRRRACRRDMTRIPKSGKIKYYTDWPQRGRGAEMVDLSPSGMRFVCDEHLKPGRIIKVAGSLLKAVAEIVSSRQAGSRSSRSYSIGVRFITVTFSSSTGLFVSTQG